MKQILLAALICFATANVFAEVKYNYQNDTHVSDKNCIAVLSILRDSLYDEVNVVDKRVWLRKVEPSSDVVKARSTLTKMQNALYLKYESSKQLNTHVKVQKILVKQRLQERGAGYLDSLINQCVN